MRWCQHLSEVWVAIYMKKKRLPLECIYDTEMLFDSRRRGLCCAELKKHSLVLLINICWLLDWCSYRSLYAGVLQNFPCLSNISQYWCMGDLEQARNILFLHIALISDLLIFRWSVILGNNGWSEAWLSAYSVEENGVRLDNWYQPTWVKHYWPKWVTVSYVPLSRWHLRWKSWGMIKMHLGRKSSRRGSFVFDWYRLRWFRHLVACCINRQHGHSHVEPFLAQHFTNNHSGQDASILYRAGLFWGDISTEVCIIL